MAAPVFSSIYALIRELCSTVEALPNTVLLKEDARRASRLAKRVEVLLTDLQPYVGPDPGPMLISLLREIEECIKLMLTTTQIIATRGPMASILQGDRHLVGYQEATQRLDSALGGITGRLPPETAEEMANVRALLQRTRFELAAGLQIVMKQFRDAVDVISDSYGKLMDAANFIVAAINAGNTALSKEMFHSVLEELMSEHDFVVTHGDPHNDQLYLRSMLDIMRMHRKPMEPPVAFICPLSHQVMHDPVILMETGHSYERKAIELWYDKGHTICPRTGVSLGWRLNIVPNANLKEAIDLWRLYGALAVGFKPLVQTHYNLEVHAHKAAAGQAPKQALYGTLSDSGITMGMGAGPQSHPLEGPMLTPSASTNGRSARVTAENPGAGNSLRASGTFGCRGSNSNAGASWDGAMGTSQRLFAGIMSAVSTGTGMLGTLITATTNTLGSEFAAALSPTTGGAAPGTAPGTTAAGTPGLAATAPAYQGAGASTELASNSGAGIQAGGASSAAALAPISAAELVGSLGNGDATGTSAFSTLQAAHSAAGGSSGHLDTSAIPAAGGGREALGYRGSDVGSHIVLDSLNLNSPPSLHVDNSNGLLVLQTSAAGTPHSLQPLQQHADAEPLQQSQLEHLQGMYSSSEGGDVTTQQQGNTQQEEEGQYHTSLPQAPQAVQHAHQDADGSSMFAGLQSHDSSVQRAGSEQQQQHVSNGGGGGDGFDALLQGTIASAAAVAAQSGGFTGFDDDSSSTMPAITAATLPATGLGGATSLGGASSLSDVNSQGVTTIRVPSKHLSLGGDLHTAQQTGAAAHAPSVAIAADYQSPDASPSNHQPPSRSHLQHSSLYPSSGSGLLQHGSGVLSQRSSLADQQQQPAWFTAMPSSPPPGITAAASHIGVASAEDEAASDLEFGDPDVGIMPGGLGAAAGMQHLAPVAGSSSAVWQ